MKYGALISGFLSVVAVQAQMVLDPAFGVGGLVTTSFGPKMEIAYNLVLQPDGKIIAVGNYDPLAGVYDSDLMLVRYNTDGTVDSTFGTNGMTLVDVSGDEHAMDVALQADGSIVVAGTAFQAPGQNKLVMRFTPGGMLDPSFGTGGVVVIDDSFQFENLRALALQTDEKIVVAGEGYNDTIVTFYLARLNTDGSLDSSFSDDGGLHLIVDTAGSFAMDVAIQNDGRIVCVGDAGAAGGQYDPAVVRLLPDGTLDSTFSGDGKTMIHWSNALDYVQAVALQLDGKILIAGGDSSQSQASTVAVSRFFPDGSVDTTFGVNGTVRTVTGLGVDTRCTAMTLDDNAHILLAGSFRPSPTDTRSYLCRLLDDGSLDPSFGVGGELIHSTPGVPKLVWGMALQADGAIVLAGLYGESSTGNVLLMRYADPTTGTVDRAIEKLRILQVRPQHIDVIFPFDGSASYQVFDGSGRTVAEGSARARRNERCTIPFDRPPPAGIHTLSLRVGHERIAAAFVVVTD